MTQLEPLLIQFQLQVHAGMILSFLNEKIILLLCCLIASANPQNQRSDEVDIKIRAGQLNPDFRCAKGDKFILECKMCECDPTTLKHILCTNSQWFVLSILLILSLT